MEHTKRDHEYVSAVAAAIVTGTPNIDRWLTDRCTECDMRFSEMTPAHADEHLIVAGNVIVGCEGYWLVNPNVVGFDNERWSDWTDYDPVRARQWLNDHGIITQDMNDPVVIDLRDELLNDPDRTAVLAMLDRQNAGADYERLLNREVSR